MWKSSFCPFIFFLDVGKEMGTRNLIDEGGKVK